MLPALLLLLACPPEGPRPVVTGTVSVAADGRVSGDFLVRTDAPDRLHTPFGAAPERTDCAGDDVFRVQYTDATARRGPDGALFMLGLAQAWVPHSGSFHDMQVWLRIPRGWSGRLSGERPTIAPARCEAETCLMGPFLGTGQPGAMLTAAPKRLHAARGHAEVFVAPEHEAALEPLLDTLVQMDEAFTARFGPRATKSLTVYEVETDGGFSVHGMIALSSGAVAKFAEGDAEAPLLAHEICHHWFGSVASGEPWLTEGLCRHCELWWVRRTRPASAAEAFEEQLARQSEDARPGLTLGGMTGAPPAWRDFEAIAYSRGALVAQRFSEALGPEVWDAAIRAHLRAHRAQRVEIGKFLAVTASVAPEADVASLKARWLDVDVDVRTGEPRGVPLTVSTRVGAPVALLTFGVTLLVVRRRRDRAASGGVLGAVAIALWQSPGWVLAWQVLVVAAAWLAASVWLRRRAPSAA